jgi:DNA ligase D-like protein (predicted ligase)
MLAPMLATIGDTSDLDRTGWIFEPKLDGERALCYKNTDLSFINRRGRDITDLYPEFTFARQLTATSCILDGEVIVYDSAGNPSFQLIQKRMHTTPQKALARCKTYPATFVAFDILAKNGEDLTKLPLRQRQEILRQTARDGGQLQTVVSTPNGHRLWMVVHRRHLEGVMAKNPDSLYLPGVRTKDWRKVKLHKTIDCVIVGFTSENQPLSSLALGLHIGGELRYCGKVGTGFSQSTLTLLYETLTPLLTPKPAVVNPVRNVLWVEPTLVCEIQYLQLTSNLEFRAPVFLRLRTDKLPEECTLEGEVTVTW